MKLDSPLGNSLVFLEGVHGYQEEIFGFYLE